MILLLASADGCSQEGLFVVEVAVQRPGGNPGGLRDVLEFHCVEAAIDEESDSLLEDLLLAVFGASLDGGHGSH